VWKETRELLPIRSNWKRPHLAAYSGSHRLAPPSWELLADCLELPPICASTASCTLIRDRCKLRAWRVPGLHGDTPGRGALGRGGCCNSMNMPDPTERALALQEFPPAANNLKQPANSPDFPAQVVLANSSAQTGSHWPAPFRTRRRHLSGLFRPQGHHRIKL